MTINGKSLKEILGIIRNRVTSFLKELYIMIKSNLRSLVIFVVLFTIVNAIIPPTLIRLILVLALRINGVTYLGPDNLSTVLLSPWTLMLIIPALLAICLPPIFEVSGVLHGLSMSKIGKKTSVSGMISAGLHGCFRSLHPKNWLIFFFIMILVPFTGVLSFYSETFYMAIPEFIRDFISADGVYNILYKILYVILLVIFLFNIFMLDFYSLEDKSVLQACKESQRIIRKKHIRTVLWVLITSFLFYIFSVGMSAILSDIIIHVTKLFVGSSGVLTDSERIINTMNGIRSVFVGIIAPIINLSAITVLFYEYIEEEHGLVKVSKRAFNDTKLTWKQIVASCVVVAGFIVLTFTVDGYSLKANDPDYLPQVVAHRGDSVRAPENTMAAFRLAAEENPDWVEFDVHETKDGVMIVSHDDDLSRVAGQQLFVHDLTYSEAHSLDVGSWFSPKFSYIRLATLNETLRYFKNFDFGIQIEIKPSGYDVDLEEKVIQCIRENEMEDRCIITSLDLDTLLRVEEIAPDMITTYSMFVAWQHIEDIPVDYFTVEESNVERVLVDNVHAAGKKIFAWTANTEDIVQYLYDCGVDGILTDDPIMMQNALENIQTENGFLRVVRLLGRKIIKGY